MRLKVICEIYLVLLLIGITCFSSTVQSSVNRNKRTIDLVLRSVADAFGYDIQKLPTVLPPAATTPAPVASTFFPPPVKPLPPAPKPVLIFPLAPRASLPPPKAPPAPPPPLPVAPKIPPVPPRAAPPPPRPLPASPKAPPPPPKAPPVPRASPQPPPPPPPPPKTPAPPQRRPAPPPVLTETLQKTFNLNFNWNKNVQPGQPACAPPAAAPPAKPSAAAPPAPAPPPPPPAAAPPAPAPPPPPPAVPQGPGGQKFLKRPQLYREHDYVDEEASKENLPLYEEADKQSLREDYEQRLQQENVDYPDYQNQQLGQDYSETIKNYKMKPYGTDLNESKERFKESVDAFWKSFPLTDQHGYKYIAIPESQHETGQFSQNFPTDYSKYEEYDIPPSKSSDNANEECNKNHHSHTEAVNQQPEPSNVRNTPEATTTPDYEEHEAYIYIIPKDYADYYSEEPQSKSEEPQSNNEENPHFADKYIIESEPPKEQLQSFNRQQSNQADKLTNRRENSSGAKDSAETVAHPLYSGILPIQLHHLASSESQSKPWPVPYDYEIEGTENKNKFVKKYSAPQNSRVHRSENVDTDRTFECCQKQSASSHFDFYTVPEPKPIDYAQYEKLHTDDEDEGFSKNAKIQTKEKKISVIKTNKYENPVKY